MVFIALSLTLLSCWVHLPAVLFQPSTLASRKHCFIRSEAMRKSGISRYSSWSVEVRDTLMTSAVYLARSLLQSDQLQVKWTPNCTSKAAKGFPNAKDFVESIYFRCGTRWMR